MESVRESGPAEEQVRPPGQSSGLPLRRNYPFPYFNHTRESAAVKMFSIGAIANLPKKGSFNPLKSSLITLSTA